MTVKDDKIAIIISEGIKTITEIFWGLDFFCSWLLNRNMLKESDPHSSAKAVVAFLIVALAFTVLVVFYKNRLAILESGNLKSFVFLVFLGCSFLLTLLFLVNKPLVGKNKRKR